MDLRDLHVRHAYYAVQDVLKMLLRDLLFAIKGSVVEVQQVQRVWRDKYVHSVFRELEPRLQLLGVVEVALDRIASELSVCSDEVESRGLAYHALSAVASHEPLAAERLVFSSFHGDAVVTLLSDFRNALTAKDRDSLALSTLN